MMYFILLINFIEVFLFSSFIAFYFDLNNKMRYTLIVGLLNYLITNISSYYSYDGVLLTVFVILITILGLVIETKRITFEFLFIPIIYNIIIMLCTTASLWIITSTFSISSTVLFTTPSIFIGACILSKLLQFIFSILFYSFGKKNIITLKLKEWWIIIVSEVSMIISIGLCLYSLNSKILSFDILKVLLFLSILTNILFYLVILMSNKNNAEKIKNANEIQKYIFNKQKYQTIEHLKKETDSLNHRMFYILWQIEWLAEKKDIDQIKDTVKKYKNLLNQNQYVINTGNDIFDCLLSLKLSKCFDNGTDLKVSIAIQKNDFYDSLEFINHINNIIDKIIIDNNYIDFSMLEINSFLVISICIKEYKDQYIDLQKSIDLLSEVYNAKYNIFSEDNSYNAKISIPIIKKE